MKEILIFLATTAHYLLTLYSWIVIAAVILSLLITFNVVNSYNMFVQNLNQALRVVTEPLFRQVRRILPATGAFDFSPIIVLVGIWVLQNFIATVVLPQVGRI